MGRMWSWDAQGISGIECFRACAVQHRYARHSHPCYAIGVFEGGVGGMDFRGAAHYIPDGDIVVMNPDEPHTGYAEGNQPMSYRMLYVAEDTFRQLMPEHAPLPYFRSVHIHNDHWAAQLVLLHHILETSVEPAEQQCYTDEILTNFACACGGNQFSELARHEPLAVARAKEFLRANYQRCVNIDEIADLTQLSRAYLIRAFTRSVGIPPYHWLLQLRIEEAKTLLAHGTPISEVAFEVGFADQSHFTRRFKSITGLTPGQYAAGHYRSRQENRTTLA